MQHTNEETKTQTTKVGPAPVEPVDWVALKRQKPRCEYLAQRVKKPRSGVVTWQTFKEGETLTRSPIYQKLIPKGWGQRVQDLERIIKSIKDEMQNPSTEISFEVKENGVCALIFLEMVSDDGQILRFKVNSIEGKQGPWDSSGTDMGDLRTSGFHLIVQSLLSNCNFETPKELFPGGAPPGLLVQAELLFGLKTSHMTVTQMIFRIKNEKNPQEKRNLLESFVLKIFGVSLFRRAENILEDDSTVELLPLSTVDQIVSYWVEHVRYSPSHASGSIQNLHRVPQMFFKGGFDENAFREFYAEHCSAGVGNGEEGFIMKQMTKCDVEGVPPDFIYSKIKRIYKRGQAHLFLPSPNNMLLLMMPHGCTKDSLPLGLICAPPLNQAENPRLGREIAATFFQPVTDPDRGDFEVAFKGGEWDAIEGFLCFYRDLIKRHPDSLCKVTTGKEEYGYTPVTYETTLDTEPCTCLVRTAHTKNYVIMGLELTYSLDEEEEEEEECCTPFALAYRLNQIVPQRKTPKGMLYVLDTNVFVGLVTPWHLKEDAAQIEKEFQDLDDPEKDLSFSQKCKYKGPFLKLPTDYDAWDPQKFFQHLKANITHLTPGMSPDSINQPCAVDKYFKVLYRAITQKNGPLPSARHTVAPVKNTEALAFITAREWWGADFDLVGMCKSSTAPQVQRMVELLEKSKTGTKLSDEENEFLNKTLISVKRSWTTKITSNKKKSSVGAGTPAPVLPQISKVLQAGEVAHAGSAATNVVESDESGPLEIGSGEPIGISRNRLLVMRNQEEFLSGDMLDPLLAIAYKLENYSTILLIMKYLNKRIAGENMDSDPKDEPSPKKAKMD